MQKLVIDEMAFTDTLVVIFDVGSNAILCLSHLSTFFMHVLGICLA
jgi:hypothetical protein